jgi:hypothetical protein
VSKTTTIWIVAALTAGMAAPAGAQQIDREHVRALIDQALAQTPAAPGVQGDSGPTVQLTVQQAVERALDKNLTLASERITPQTWDLQIAATMANYRPNLTSAFTTQSAVQLNTNIFAGGSRVTQDTNQWSGGIAQNLWWGGGAYTLNWTNSRATACETLIHISEPPRD